MSLNKIPYSNLFLEATSLFLHPVWMDDCMLVSRKDTPRLPFSVTSLGLTMYNYEYISPHVCQPLAVSQPFVFSLQWHTQVWQLIFLLFVVVFVSLQAFGPQTAVPSSRARFWWMVWCSKLPLWPLQQQHQTQRPGVQQLRDGWQVVSRSDIHTSRQKQRRKSL